MIFALLLAAAQPANDPVADTREIMAGTVVTPSIKQEYLSGKRDGTTPFKGALEAYKKVRMGPIGELPIADTFNTAGGLTAAPLPSKNFENVGAFRFMCQPGQILFDDPIVYPGQPGVSPHAHQFFGNETANGKSTYQSLRTTGTTTCGRDKAHPLNRSSYWVAAVDNGIGGYKKPTWINTYYKRRPKSDPACNPSPDRFDWIGQCVELPNGLKLLFGYNMTVMTGGPTDDRSIDRWMMSFECWKGDGPIAPKFQNLRDVQAACPVSHEIVVQMTLPACWDGRNTDSADHRSHMAYTENRSLAYNYAPKCPDTHPYLIPTISIALHYDTDAQSVAGLWKLTSDVQMEKKMGHPVVPGTTLHGDYWEAWSPTVKKAWHEGCIDKHLSCSNGNLGNGLTIRDAGVPAGGWPKP